MNFARQRWIIRADREQRDVDLETVADFFEAREISGVPAVKNGPVAGADDEPAKAAVLIGQKAGPPMVGRRERNFEGAEPNPLPFFEFMDDIKSEAMHQIPDPNWDNDRLIGGNRAESAPIEMIEMRVRHEHEINRRQMMDMKAGIFQAFDHFQP